MDGADYDLDRYLNASKRVDPTSVEGTLSRPSRC